MNEISKLHKKSKDSSRWSLSFLKFWCRVIYSKYVNFELCHFLIKGAKKPVFICFWYFKLYFAFVRNVAKLFNLISRIRWTCMWTFPIDLSLLATIFKEIIWKKKYSHVFLECVYNELTKKNRGKTMTDSKKCVSKIKQIWNKIWLKNPFWMS